MCEQLRRCTRCLGIGAAGSARRGRGRRPGCEERGHARLAHAPPTRAARAAQRCTQATPGGRRERGCVVRRACTVCFVFAQWQQRRAPRSCARAWLRPWRLLKRCCKRCKRAAGWRRWWLRFLRRWRCTFFCAAGRPHARADRSRCRLASRRGRRRQPFAARALTCSSAQVELPLVSRTELSHDTRRFRFALPVRTAAARVRASLTRRRPRSPHSTCWACPWASMS